MTELMHLDSQRLYGGVLRCEGDAPAEELDLITQCTNDIEVLLRDANEAQPLMRSKIAPEDVWVEASDVAGVEANESSESSESSGASEQGTSTCRVARRASCTDRVVEEGLLAYADEALDPGAKRRLRVIEKAMFKY